jgi:hypothetical protein
MRAILSMTMAAMLTLSVTPCFAAVNVQRSGAENPMQEVAKSVLWGGLAGVVLGSAVALADDGGNDGDQIKWGFVAGTFFGFGFGLYHVMSRPSAEALIEIEDGKAHLAAALPTVDVRHAGIRVALVHAKF